jgi:tetratricopeptide (TPR) repeat protein
MRAAIAIVLLIIPAAARADAYDDHMKAGDAFEQKSKWKDALKEYEAALVAKPGDAHALVEIGWAACMAGNVARAREASEQALGIAGIDPKLRGAALFNLGVTYEKDDPIAAASLEFAGYMLRPNATVAKRLEGVEKKLDRQGAMTAKSKTLLAKLHVDPIDIPRKGKPFAKPIDAALIVAFTKAGVVFEGAAGKSVAIADKLYCVEHGTEYECGNPDAKGDVARAIFLNLEQRKIEEHAAMGRRAYDVTARCTLRDMAEEADDCEVATR